MYGKVSLNFGNENRVVLSDKAIIKQQGTNDRYVYTLNDDNTVTYKRVELGRRLANQYEILSGISEGEKVVVEGNTNLVGGKKVLVIEN